MNITGGLRTEDPAADLAVIASLASSYEDIALADNLCFAGEIGLGGEIRAVHRLEQRITEADKLGFKEIYVSKFGIKGLNTKKSGIKIRPVGSLGEVLEGLFAGK